MPESREFKLSLPGLLQVLAEHLYSDRRVGVRELLQNAHDSCSRRKIEYAESDYAPRIDLRIDSENHILEIEDNGTGLTESEIDQYLTTIGSGYTRHLRESLAFGDDGAIDQLIGQFGLGFLSAFLLAESVELDTLSQRPDSKPIHWRSTGDGSFDMQPGTREKVGTRIRLVCKPAMRHLLNDRIMRDLIVQYGDLLPHPIYLEPSPIPLNRGEVPWASEDFESNMADFFRQHDIAEPLWMIPLQNWSLKCNHDSISVPLEGAIFIPHRSVASLHEFGDAMVYIQNMFICRNQRTLLPKWAKFARAIVSSPMLQPTASRESIHEDEGFEAVAQALDQQILQALEELAENQPEVWTEIVRAHTDLIIGWATSNEQFFERFVDKIQLETNMGRKTLKECHGNGTSLYYRKGTARSPAERLVTDSLGLPVIDTSWFGVLPLLDRFGEYNPHIDFVECDESLSGMITSVSGRRFQPLFKLLEETGMAETIVAARFEPLVLSAIVTYPPEAQILRQAQSAMDDNSLIPGIADIVPDWVKEKEESIDNLDGTFYVNVESALVQRLNQLATEGRLATAPLFLLVQMTRLLCQPQVDQDSEQQLVTLNQALMELLPE